MEPVNKHTIQWIEELNLEESFKLLIYHVYSQVKKYWSSIDELAIFNQHKVLEAFREERVNENDFRDSTGYGYHDEGREKLENVFAHVFGAEKALVRPQILSGTHALTVSLFGLLRPGDILLSLTGSPYDTLLSIIGANKEEEEQNGCDRGTLQDWGVEYQQIPLDSSGLPDPNSFPAFFHKPIKVALIQKSPGYSVERPALNVHQIEEIVKKVRRYSPQTTVLVDNCYGELVEEAEPLEAGADVIAGSLIKNPGGGLAPTGGYVAGKEEHLKKIAARYSAPGLEDKLGSMNEKRLYFMGLFQAPQLIASALKTVLWAAALLGEMGYTTEPSLSDNRGDLVQKIRMNSPEEVKLFVQTIQQFSPVDSFVTPEPFPMPGYKDPVIMGAGTFIQGASSELSCDAPMRPPYTAFLQGGLTLGHGLVAVTRAAEALQKQST